MPYTLEDVFQPGSAIELTYLTETAQFEEAIRQKLKPQLGLTALNHWRVREPLKEILRPTGVIGSITDISFQAMNDPVESFLSARSRGYLLQSGLKIPYTAEKIAEQREKNNALGFVFTALTKSSGRNGGRAQLQSELWYYNKDEVYKDDRSAFPGPIRRIVAKPKIEQDAEKFIAVGSNVERFSIGALQANFDTKSIY